MPLALREVGSGTLAVLEEALARHRIQAGRPARARAPGRHRGAQEFRAGRNDLPGLSAPAGGGERAGQR
ncbi:MAG: hypothetical protein WKG07_10180 [Hymenobacter sp.]